MAESIGSRVRRALADANWSQADLARATGIDKNTISALVNDKTQPRAETVAAVEAALALTPGTLVDGGEDPRHPRADLAKVSSGRLAAELAARVADYEELVTEWELPALRFDRRNSATYEYALAHEGDPGQVGDACRALARLDSVEASRSLTPEEECELDAATLVVDAARCLASLGLAWPSPIRLATVAEARRERERRLQADALPEDRAASHQDGGLSDPDPMM